MKDPKLTIDRLARLVEAEPLMSTKVVRMANSVAMNPSGRAIADVRSAITRIGMEAVRSVSFAVAMEQLLGSKNMAPFEALSRRLWEHSMHVAALCRLLARKVGGINPDEAMFAGMVHDIGVFYLLSRAANFQELIADRHELNQLLVQWHDNIGHALLSAMGQSDELLAAVQEHECARALVKIKTLSDLVYVANVLANVRNGWRDAEFAVAADAAGFAELFGEGAIDDLLIESAAEVSSLKSALGAQ